MAVLDLRYYGDPVLRQIAAPIENIDDKLARFAEDLIETMLVKNGIGLAANQVGKAIRIYAVDPSGDDEGEKPFVLINPVIIETSGEQNGDEGCLSFPGLFEKLTRPQRVLVEAIDIDGNPIRLEREGLIARVILHEYDHLEGKLFIDYLSFLRRQLINGKLRKLKAGDIEVFR